ncbi:MAG: MBL fold metallo-hydrolase [Pseudomonadales bacterium]
MQFASIGSGSRGNATVIKSADCCVVVDCGFSLAETKRRLASIDITVEQIDALLVTHEHSDHCAGVEALAKRHAIPVYATHGTQQKLKLESEAVHTVCSNTSFRIKDLTVQPTLVPHDAREPVQYTFSTNGLKVGVLTDLGSITPHVLARFRDCDALLVESNHDRELLHQGPYPAQLKARVGGDWGHLSNAQTADFLRNIDLAQLQHLVVAHISDKNNTRQHVQHMLEEFQDQLANWVFADQNYGFDWLVLNKRYSS